MTLPPRPTPIEHPGFSPLLFAGLAIPVSIVAAALLACVARAARRADRQAVAQVRRFPPWGWAGVLLVGASWAAAWTRLDWLAALQHHTFTPLWLGYIVTVNALCHRRTGRCLLTDRPGFVACLFAASAVCWWLFEYLNRFVGNWYYVGVAHFSAIEYVVHASIAFSTVLPAVLSTERYLASFTLLSSAFSHLGAVPPPPRAAAGGGLVVIAVAGLLGIGRHPEYLFPLLWVSPLLVMLGVQLLSDRATGFASIARGDWRPVCLPSLAALACGFFWELWNSRSLAHWEYSIPFVDRFHLFEMPALGYAGYLPFGLECVVVVRLLRTG